MRAIFNNNSRNSGLEVLVLAEYEDFYRVHHYLGEIQTKCGSKESICTVYKNDNLLTINASELPIEKPKKRVHLSNIGFTQVHVAASRAVEHRKRLSSSIFNSIDVMCTKYKLPYDLIESKVHLMYPEYRSSIELSNPRKWDKIYVQENINFLKGLGLYKKRGA